MRLIVIESFPSLDYVVPPFASQSFTKYGKVQSILRGPTQSAAQFVSSIAKDGIIRIGNAEIKRPIVKRVIAEIESDSIWLLEEISEHCSQLGRKFICGTLLAKQRKKILMVVADYIIEGSRAGRRSFEDLLAAATKGRIAFDAIYLNRHQYAQVVLAAIESFSNAQYELVNLSTAYDRLPIDPIRFDIDSHQDVIKGAIEKVLDNSRQSMRDEWADALLWLLPLEVANNFIDDYIKLIIIAAKQATAAEDTSNRLAQYLIAIRKYIKYYQYRAVWKSLAQCAPMSVRYLLKAGLKREHLKYMCDSNNWQYAPPGIISQDDYDALAIQLLNSDPRALESLPEMSEKVYVDKAVQLLEKFPFALRFATRRLPQRERDKLVLAAINSRHIGEFTYDDNVLLYAHGCSLRGEVERAISIWIDLTAEKLASKLDPVNFVRLPSEKFASLLDKVAKRQENIDAIKMNYVNRLRLLTRIIRYHGGLHLDAIDIDKSGQSLIKRRFVCFATTLQPDDRWISGSRATRKSFEEQLEIARKGILTDDSIYLNRAQYEVLVFTALKAYETITEFWDPKLLKITSCEHASHFSKVSGKLPVSKPLMREPRSIDPLRFDFDKNEKILMEIHSNIGKRKGAEESRAHRRFKDLINSYYKMKWCPLCWKLRTQKT